VGIRDIGGSLAILKGPCQFVTIKVERFVDNSNIVVLIYGGATHNFIDGEFVRKKGFKTKEFS